MFTKMKRDDLYHLATENFALEIDQTANKAQIIAALAENDISWETASAVDPAAREIVEKEAERQGVITADQLRGSSLPTSTVTVEAPALVEPDRVLVKMERENPRYDIRGYKFTAENPFVLVKEQDVDYVISHEDGFKIATPREAKEYYG